MVRPKSCNKLGLKKGPWTPEEDQKLVAFIQEHGHGSWRSLPSKAGLQRCGKSCRLRWSNYLRPDIKRGKFNLQEEQSIIQLHALLGNRWSAIATHLPRRTDNEIKNYWNTHLKKKLDKMGIDAVTHKPKTNSLSSSTSTAHLSHMAQWESARLQAEARLVRESKLQNQMQAHAQAPARAQTQTQAQTTTRPTQPTVTTSRPQCLDVLTAWQGVVFGMFSAGAGGGTASLESPTSTLKVPGGHALPPTFNPPTDPVECNSYSNKLRKEHGWDPLMHETMPYSINNGGWYGEPFKAGDDVDGGISDILLGQNSDSSSVAAGLEENKKNVNCYWSSLLMNLVDDFASDQNAGLC